MIKWRRAGEKMGTVDLSELRGDQIVIHYGGTLHSVDAYTFANSLIAFADTVKAVNKALEPSQSVTVRLEAIGDGSFRAVLKRIPKGIGGLLAKAPEKLFWGIVVTLIYDKLMKDDPSVTINVNDDSVVLEQGDDRVIIPRAVYDGSKTISDNTDVQRNISRTFEIIENDQAVENFGLTTNLKDETPIFQVDRDRFAILSDTPTITPTNPSQRLRNELVRLVILKAWLKKGNYKWQFEMNGFPISAPIKDDEFLDKLINREFLIGYGEALDVELSWVDEYDEELKVYRPNPSTYQVEKIVKVVPRGGSQRQLFED